MTDQPFERRNIDRVHAEIRDLILKTDDPKDKAQLLIMLKFSDSIDTLSGITKEVSGKLDEHLDHYDKHITEGAVRDGQVKLGWKLIVAFLAASQGVAWYAIKGHLESDHALEVTVSTIRKDVDMLQERRRIEDTMQKVTK